MFGNMPLAGKEVSMEKVMSSVYSNVNGHKTSHDEMEEEVSQNGKVVAKVSQKVDAAPDEKGELKTKAKVEVDIPSKDIHRTIVKEGRNMEVVDGQDFSNNGQRRSSNTAENGIDKINSYAGLEYTPLDMAEYIFWTGDEKGVVMAIEEFLEEGLMSREEAINFLQSIKTNLDYMQEHYHGLQKTENRVTSAGGSNIHDRLSDLEKPSNYDYDVPQENEKMKSDSYDDASSKYEIPLLKPDPYEIQAKIQLSRYDNPMKLKSLAGQGSYSDRKKRFKDVKTTNNGATLSDEDFEDLLERLRVADFLYSEYSLEEVIYQLAKVVFSQSLSRGSADAQLALQRFTSFLEKEARLGQISRSLEKKIIDLLIAALSDTLTEHPQLLSGVRESLNDGEPNLSSSMMLKNQMQSNQENPLPVNRNLGKASMKTSSIVPNKVPTSKN